MTAFSLHAAGRSQNVSGQMGRHRCGVALKTGRRSSTSTRPCAGSITRSCRRHLVRKTRATAVGYALRGRHPFQMQPLAFSACQVTRGWSVTPVQQVFFGDDVSLTVCQECEAGHFSSTTRLTPCDRCLKGSFWVAKDVGCQECSPGQFLSQSMTTCSPCGAGRVQSESGQSACHPCSPVHYAGGPNAHLWTTLIRNEHTELPEFSGSRSARDCGNVEGSWLDALSQRQECGEGVTCKGMGEVSVPGVLCLVLALTVSLVDLSGSFERRHMVRCLRESQRL